MSSASPSPDPRTASADFHLRPATLDDLPALNLLIAASVRGLSPGYYSAAQIESALRHVFGPDTQLIRDGTYFVVEPGDGGDGLAGCGGWSRRRTLYGGDQMKSGDDRLLDPATEPARIRAFFVHPALARRGLGRRMLEACIAAARAHGFHSLELVATLPGEPLYRAGGFAAVERCELNLPDGVKVPVVKMTRVIA